MSHCCFTYCLVVALSIVPFGRLFLDGYFVHQCYQAFVQMESCECEIADDTDAEQLVTVHCTSAQQNGEGSAAATAKADHLAADRLRKKCSRAEVITEDCAVRLQSYHSFLHND